VKHAALAIVSRETPAIARQRNLSLTLSSESTLFSDTKFPEDHVKDVFDVDPTQQLAETMRSPTQLLRDEFLAVADHDKASPQGRCSVLQQDTLSFSGNQTDFLAAKKRFDEIDQPGD
jgi:hypothetical protein